MNIVGDCSSIHYGTELDFSFLEQVTPRSGDLLLPLDGIDIEAEISQLEKEISSIDLRSIPFDKFDIVIVFIAGIIGAACDIIIGKPANGYNGILTPPKEPIINDEFAFGLGKHLKHYDLSNNPIDKTIPGIPVGDHRLYSYGHDLFRVFQTVGVMLTGKGPIGISGLGGEIYLEQPPEKWLEQLAVLGIDSSNPGLTSIVKILVVLFLHLYKDYCSARSLPIPGLSYIAKLNHERMPKFLDELTNEKELNLRTLNGQILSIVSIEIVISIYAFIRKKTEETIYTNQQYKSKKERLLLISHSIAMAFNVGKVVVTQNPAFITFPQIIRIVRLAWNIIKDKIDLKQKSVEKVNMSLLKNQLETAQTLILLNDSIYYTKQIDAIISDMKKEFDKNNLARQKNLQNGFNKLDNMLAQVKYYNE